MVVFIKFYISLAAPINLKSVLLLRNPLLLAFVQEAVVNRIIEPL